LFLIIWSRFSNGTYPNAILHRRKKRKQITTRPLNKCWRGGRKGLGLTYKERKRVLWISKHHTHKNRPKHNWTFSPAPSHDAKTLSPAQQSHLRLFTPNPNPADLTAPRQNPRDPLILSTARVAFGFGPKAGGECFRERCGSVDFPDDYIVEGWGDRVKRLV